MAGTDIVRGLASDVAVVWSDLLAAESKPSLRQHVRAVLTENGCLPSQVIDRMTQYRIRPVD